MKKLVQFVHKGKLIGKYLLDETDDLEIKRGYGFCTGYGSKHPYFMWAVEAIASMGINNNTEYFLARVRGI